MFNSLRLLVLFLGLTSTALASTTWYVDGVNGNDNNNCITPQTACKTIGHAMSLASSGDSIMIAPATYTENLSININLKLIGSGARTTIIDGGGSQYSVIATASGTEVVLSKVSIVNSANTGILTSGTLTINNSIISRNGSPFNYAGGIHNFGTLTINHCTIMGNHATAGGGIYHAGSKLAINNSTISGNFARLRSCCPEGGGIADIGSGMTINNSTISGNRTRGPGGGIYNYTDTITVNNSTISGNDANEGGGIYNTGTLTIYRTTISGNSAGVEPNPIGGGVWTAAILTLNNSTVSGNSSLQYAGGIYAVTATITVNNSTISVNGANDGGGILNNGSTATFQNSIVANSPSGGNCSGTMTSSGYNLSSDNTCNFNNTGDLNNTDPKLGLLQNNGGPTKTQALLSGSPAIDAGNPNGCTDSNGHLLKTDQRGKPRPDKEDSGGCDMGAFERQKD
jgi:hypothetical protein